jgi:CRISPR/Cas system CMR-associated protein Cmr5 small subunit
MSNSVVTNHLFTGPTGQNNNIYIFNGDTIDVSENKPSSLSCMDEIDRLMKKISCESVQGLGTFSDYEELFKVAQELTQLKLTLDLQSFEEIAQKARIIKETFESFVNILPTVLNLVSMENLIRIRDSLCSILSMLDTIENFSFVIRNQFVIRNEWMVNHIGNTLGCVYNHLDNIFCHDNSQHNIPYYLLANPCPQAQIQINRMNEYTLEMLNFADSLGINNDCNFCKDDINESTTQICDIISSDD